MVTSTPSENLFYHRYELQNQNFYFETAKTWILHAWSIFFKGAQLTKLWSKKIFSMKTLLKLGALTVYIKNSLLISRMEQADSRTVRVN
jgi:hypothetical protein